MVPARAPTSFLLRPLTRVHTMRPRPWSMGTEALAGSRRKVAVAGTES
jgi:hypothetical protein